MATNLDELCEAVLTARSAKDKRKAERKARRRSRKRK